MKRRRSEDAIVRLFRIAMMLPRAPRKIATRTIFERLVAAGYAVTVRTVERDLHRLRGALPITLDDAHKPYGWSLDRDAQTELGV